MKKSVPGNRDTDKELVRRVLRGDVSAFSDIVREHSPRMMGLAAGMVRGREAAEDVVQDALVKAYEKLGSWRGESSLSTWLYRIVYTTAVSSLRGSRPFFDDPETVPDSEADDGEWQPTEESIARMRLALEMLSAPDRTVVNLFYMEERPVRDVAAICGVSEANVKTRLHRARVRLKKLMGDV